MIQLSNLLVEAPGKGRSKKASPGSSAKTKTRGMSGPGNSGPASIVEPVVIICLGVLLAVAGGVFYLDGRDVSTREQLFREVGQAIRDSLSLDDNVELATHLRIRSGEINERIGLVTAKDKGRFVWPHIMDQMALVIPADVWVERWAQKSTIEGSHHIRIEIEGYASSAELIHDFIHALNASPFLAEVAFISSSEVKFGDHSTQHFILEAVTEDPDPSMLEMEAFGPEGRIQSTPAEPVSGSAGNSSNQPWLPSEPLPSSVPRP